MEKEIKEVTSLSDFKKILDKGNDISAKLSAEWSKGAKRNLDSLVQNLDVAKVLINKELIIHVPKSTCREIFFL